MLFNREKSLFGRRSCFPFVGLLRQQIVLCCLLTQFQRVCRSRGLECIFKEADLRSKPSETSRVIHSDSHPYEIFTVGFLQPRCHQKHEL